MMADIDTSFGYKGRHILRYDLKSQTGKITLWSFYDNSILSWQNIYTAIPIGGATDIFGLLVGLKLAGKGQVHGFTNINGCLIKVFREDNKTFLKLGANTNTGELSDEEAEDLSLILKDILVKSGVSYAEIESRITF